MGSKNVIDLISLLLLLNIAAFAEQKGSFTDSRDGKKYKTVKIGEQTWMAENLNHEMTSFFARDKNKCYDNKPQNCNKYGRLYNWGTAKKACPDGWHLPNNDEWQELFLYADGISTTRRDLNSSNTAGKLLKAASGWNNNGNGTDKFGFAAQPGGSGDSTGNFEDIGKYGVWWSATDINIRYAHHRLVTHSNDRAGVSNTYKTSLLSVRCVIGDTEPPLVISDEPKKTKMNKGSGGIGTYLFKGELDDECLNGRKGPILEGECLGGKQESAKNDIILKNVTILKSSRSKEDVMKVVNARMPELSKTYKSYLKQHSSFTGGKLTLKFTISPKGDVTQISIVSSETNDSAFDEDIKGQVSKWKWEVISGDKNTTPTIPFNFSE